MNVKIKIRNLLLVSIAAGTLGLAGAASAGTQVGASVTISGTRAAVVDSGAEHVCTYEQRPVTRTYTDASGGRYEQRTYETVRVCTHALVHRPIATSTKANREARPKPRKVRRQRGHTSYSAGVAYYGGAPALYRVGYNTSTYYGPSQYGYSPYPSHRYGYYGHNYGHHYSRSSVSLSYGHHSYGHHGHHGRHGHGHH